MPVAFGFSIGDFIAAIELVRTVIDTLRESSNSGTSFRALISELYALETALLHVKRLDTEIYSSVNISSLRQVASQCQDTINESWKKAQKYQPHLQRSGTNSKVKDAWYKIKWALCKEDDLANFRAQIRGHTSSLDILLSTIQLEALTIDRRKQNSLANMIQNFSCSILNKLGVITTTIAESVRQGKELFEVSTQIVQGNLRLFQAVHDIQLVILKIPGQVQRQQPVYLIDPLNKESPFHLEFVRSVDGLLAVLKDNLKASGCGPQMIDEGGIRNRRDRNTKDD